MSKIPPLQSKIGSRGRLVVSSNQSVIRYTIIDEVRASMKTGSRKVLCLQHIKFDDDNHNEFRLGFYIFNPKRHSWVWGRFAALMSAKEFEDLTRKAQDKNWI